MFVDCEAKALWFAVSTTQAAATKPVRNAGPVAPKRPTARLNSKNVGTRCSVPESTTSERPRCAMREAKDERAILPMLARRAEPAEWAPNNVTAAKTATLQRMLVKRISPPVSLQPLVQSYRQQN
jgi:hypothetical protein